jgi:hypothetical protein
MFSILTRGYPRRLPQPAESQMVDEPENRDPKHMDRRSREQARRDARQRRMNVVGSVLTIGVIALVALVATDTLRVGGSGPTLASGKASATTSTTAANAQPQVDKLKLNQPPRALSNAAPLRLWVGGDSLSGELGYSIGPMLAKLGIVKAHVDYKVSSGLASNGVRDWPERFQEQEQQYQPEAVVFMVGANDASIVGSAKDAIGAPAWEASYRAKVAKMMDLLIGGSAQRTVFWVGSPTLGTRYDHGASELDRVMREEAAKRKTVVYVDAYSLFAENGEYSAFLNDSDGNRVQMRIGDGVHFTPAGMKFLAEHVYALLDSRWNLTKQAQPNTPIPYTISPSGGTVGGTNLGRSNNGSSATTPPVTAAPATTAPPATPPTSTAPTTTPTTSPVTTTT